MFFACRLFLFMNVRNTPLQAIGQMRTFIFLFYELQIQHSNTNIMKLKATPIYAFLFALAACSTPPQPSEEDLTQYVNPFIGTDFTGS